MAAVVPCPEMCPSPIEVTISNVVVAFVLWPYTLALVRFRPPKDDQKVAYYIIRTNVSFVLLLRTFHVFPVLPWLGYCYGLEFALILFSTMQMVSTWLKVSFRLRENLSGKLVSGVSQSTNKIINISTNVFAVVFMMGYFGFFTAQIASNEPFCNYMFVGTQTTMLVAFMVIMVITLACLRSFDKAFELLKSTAVTPSSGGSFRESKSSKSKSSSGSSGSSEVKKSSDSANNKQAERRTSDNGKESEVKKLVKGNNELTAEKQPLDMNIRKAQKAKRQTQSNRRNLRVNLLFFSLIVVAASSVAVYRVREYFIGNQIHNGCSLLESAITHGSTSMWCFLLLFYTQNPKNGALLLRQVSCWIQKFVFCRAVDIPEYTSVTSTWQSKAPTDTVTVHTTVTGRQRRISSAARAPRTSHTSYLSGRSPHDRTSTYTFNSRDRNGDRNAGFVDPTRAHTYTLGSGSGGGSGGGGGHMRRPAGSTGSEIELGFIRPTSVSAVVVDDGRNSVAEDDDDALARVFTLSKVVQGDEPSVDRSGVNYASSRENSLSTTSRSFATDHKKDGDKGMMARQRVAIDVDAILASESSHTGQDIVKSKSKSRHPESSVDANEDSDNSENVEDVVPPPAAPATADGRNPKAV